MPADRPVSSLVLAELYDSADASFLDLLLKHQGSFKPLLGLIERWKKDNRPWARRLKLDYLSPGKSRGQTRVIFKRLFKQAWADRDHELMAAFMAVLDTSIRRQRRKRVRFISRIVETTEVLQLPPTPQGEGFFTATKHYLRRRAWRYFRRLGRADPAAYLSGIDSALVRYSDDDVRAGENLLDNWGLMHACFGKSPQIQFNARHTNLAVDGRLGQLQAAPMFERHWAMPEAFAILLDILLNANCRPVRVWVIQLLRQLHADSLPKMDAATLLRLIDHADVDVAAFAADLLSNAQTVSAFPITTWMGLLATRNPTVVSSICEAFKKHVSYDRVSLPQAVELANKSATPVATIGLEILQTKSIRSEPEHLELSKLSNAKSSAMGSQIAQFAVAKLNLSRVYQVVQLIGFFDSGVKTHRSGAFAALKDQSPADTDPAFWARLFESPYDDVRTELVARLKRRADIPGASAESTATLWRTVLLNIHRGGRAKLSALSQISDRIGREPQSALMLLPVLSIALRSVRPPEARHGLAAIVRAVEQNPSLEADIKRLLPELDLAVIA